MDTSTKATTSMLEEILDAFNRHDADGVMSFFAGRLRLRHAARSDSIRPTARGARRGTSGSRGPLRRYL